MPNLCPQCNLSNPDDAVQCGCGCPLGEADSKVAGPGPSFSGGETLPSELPKPLGDPLRNQIEQGGDDDDSELPKPLGDPLRVFRYFAAFVLILQITCLVIWCSTHTALLTTAPSLYIFLAVMAMGLPGTFWTWSILPGRAVNAFYLRSFRNNLKTWPIRKAAQACWAESSASRASATRGDDGPR